MQTRLNLNGFELLKGYLDTASQEDLVGAIRGIAAQAPLFHPTTARGRRMSVRMTSAGSVGWVSDSAGYRYDRLHPDGGFWPPIPGQVLDIWRAVTGLDRNPDCCLVNYYSEGARLGLHQDRDEADFCWPVLSVSLGDDALFRMGGTSRNGPTSSVWLASGDVVVMGGAARLAYHGIDRIRFGSSQLLPKGGRINLTLRVAS